MKQNKNKIKPRKYLSKGWDHKTYLKVNTILEDIHNITNKVRVMYGKTNVY